MATIEIKKADLIMHCMIKASCRTLMLPLLTILISAGLAQAGGDGMPESPRPEDGAMPNLWPVVYSLVFLGVLLVIAFKNSHRTHLD